MQSKLFIDLASCHLTLMVKIGTLAVFMLAVYFQNVSFFGICSLIFRRLKLFSVLPYKTFYVIKSFEIAILICTFINLTLV